MGYFPANDLTIWDDSPATRLAPGYTAGFDQPSLRVSPGYYNTSPRKQLSPGVMNYAQDTENFVLFDFGQGNTQHGTYKSMQNPQPFLPAPFLWFTDPRGPGVNAGVAQSQPLYDPDTGSWG